jgi:hypothetical protein
VEQKRWAAYATAALASGFGMGLANSAEGEIHYSGPVNQKIGGRDRAKFQLDPAGGSFVVTHFNFVYGSSGVPDGGVADFVVYAAESAAANGSPCGLSEPCISKLDRRDAISTRAFVSKRGILAYDYFNSVSHLYGQFLDRGYGLIGFKFNHGAGLQYGWVRVRMLGGRKHMVQVVDYAYGDPGDTVLAGQTSNGSAPALESLGGLALGAAGLLAWRRKQ